MREWYDRRLRHEVRQERKPNYSESVGPSYFLIKMDRYYLFFLSDVMCRIEVDTDSITCSAEREVEREYSEAKSRRHAYIFSKRSTLFVSTLYLFLGIVPSRN
uniref:Uncharacterized protein n=1 Tax=Caenorhabditis japonica TaxID=281687 RepID=A0A8R1EFS6_CAEJA